MAQRITRLTTDQKIAGSNPAGIDTFFLFLVLSFFSAPPFYPHCKPDTALAKEIDAKDAAPPGGLEPPTFRLTAERASRLRHGGLLKNLSKTPEHNSDKSFARKAGSFLSG